MLNSGFFLSVPGHLSTPKAADDDWSDKSDTSYYGVHLWLNKMKFAMQ